MFEIPAKWVAAGAGALFLVLAIIAYGHGRYNAGRAASDKKWQEASAELQAKAQSAATTADASAASRTTDELNRVAQEKEKLDEANRNGSSPFDVMFGN